MYYFDSKKDLKFLHDFKNAVSLFYASQNFLFNFPQSPNMHPEEMEQINETEKMYKNSRTAVAKMLNKAIEISRRCGVSTDGISTPAPAVGGYAIPVNIYEAILNDNSHGKKIKEEWVLDKINQTIGQLEINVSNDFWNIINPIVWIKVSLAKLVRIPFWILQTSGFNGDKIEEMVLGKILKLIAILLILAGLAYLGFTKFELKKILMDKFMSFGS